MSVYRPKQRDGTLSPIYRYDFELQRHRFSGTTGETSRPAARAAERVKKEEARALLRTASERKSAPMTIDVAADRFWEETGKHYRGGAGKTFDTSLAWIVTQLGRGTPLPEITGSRVAELVARRRGEGVKPATVNRTVTEPLRRVLRRAKKAWGQDVCEIEWGQHLLAEPKERVRDLGSEEELAILKELPPGYQDVFLFALTTGFRLAECIGLRWSDIDWTGRTVKVVGKGMKAAVIPLTSSLKAMLWPLRGQHPQFVFTYPARRPRQTDGKIVRIRGERKPITYEGMKTAWRRAIQKSQVKDFRFHDTRHTAATRLLRSGANLKVVQKLLRHDDIATTSRYAHVNLDDLAEAMEVANGYVSKKIHEA